MTFVSQIQKQEQTEDTIARTSGYKTAICNIHVRNLNNSIIAKFVVEVQSLDIISLKVSC